MHQGLQNALGIKLKELSPVENETAPIVRVLGF
jgi:hypothetical protein